MWSPRLTSWCGAALILAGVSVSLWTLTHPWGSVAGAEVGGSTQWMLSHTFHFLAALFGLFGLLGLVEREFGSAGPVERWGFIIAFAGTTLFAATGAFTAFAWPILAHNAPALVEANGPFFTPPHPLIVTTAALYSIGHAVLALALAQRRVLPALGATAIVVGGVLLLIPPPPLSPLPWVVFPIGGVMFGAGLAMLGMVVRRGMHILPREVAA